MENTEVQNIGAKKRKLAVIDVVSELSPIPGADRIELARVGGWRSVVKKGAFSVGEKVVFCEVDAFLPLPHAAWDFMASKARECEGITGVRLTTMRMCKTLSQGLVVSLSDLPEHPTFKDLDVETDVTRLMGIIKWEPPIPKELAGQVKGGFNFGIPKTDEERIQNLTRDIPTEIVGHSFRRTMKLDGTSMTVYRFGSEFGVCGRNWEYRESEDNALWYTARRYNVIEALNALKLNIAVQGELMGPGIGGNKENLPRLEFFIFRIWDIEKGCFLTSEQKLEVIQKLLDAGAEMKVVPDEGIVTFDETVTVDSLLEAAKGFSINPKTLKEGDVYHRIDGNFSFKAINNDWLEKYDKN